MQCSHSRGGSTKIHLYKIQEIHLFLKRVEGLQEAFGRLPKEYNVLKVMVKEEDQS